MLTIPGITPDQAFDASPHALPLACPRGGVMIHYDDSSEDGWAIAWFKDPACTNGYTWLVTDAGRLVQLEDPGLRTPHAGKCWMKNANSYFYGIAATTNGQVPATATQFARIVLVTAALFRFHKWPAHEIPARLRGHDEQAAPRGRKVDPTGVRKDHRPIIAMDQLRATVALELIHHP